MFFNNKSFENNMMFGGQGCCCQNSSQMDCPCDPVVEPTIERCVTRDICHTVEHMCPSIPYMKIYGINRYQ